MTEKEAAGLHPGAEVYWRDPDNGECSRYFTIQSIRLLGEVAQITTKDGDSIECFLSELE